MERPDTKLIEQQVTQQLADLERALKDTNPGVYDMLQLYSGYEQTVRSAERYLAAPVSRGPVVSNNSNF